MKRTIFCSVILSLLSLPSFAGTAAEDYQKFRRPAQKPLSQVNDIRLKPAQGEGFFFKPFLSVEYSAPVMSSGGTNADFRTSHDLFSQLRDLENIALGVNFRVHRYLGFNANWAQTELKNFSLQNVGSLSREAYFRMDQYNFSTLFYAPLIENFFELFAEAGVSDMTSKLTYTTSGGVSSAQKAHQSVGFYGAGFQIKTSQQTGDAVRFSVQKYAGKMALTDTEFTTVRLGFLKSF